MFVLSPGDTELQVSVEELREERGTLTGRRIRGLGNLGMAFGLSWIEDIAAFCRDKSIHSIQMCVHSILFPYCAMYLTDCIDSQNIMYVYTHTYNIHNDN